MSKQRRNSDSTVTSHVPGIGRAKAFGLDAQNTLGNQALTSWLAETGDLAVDRQHYLSLLEASDADRNSPDLDALFQRLVKARALEQLSDLRGHIEERRSALTEGSGGQTLQGSAQADAASEIRRAATLAEELRALAARLDKGRRELSRVGSVALINYAGEKKLHRFYERMAEATEENRSPQVQAQLDELRPVPSDPAKFDAERAEIAFAAMNLEQWRQRQVDGVNAALLKVYEQYPLFTKLSSKSARGTGSDGKLIEQAQEAFGEVLTSHADVVGKIETGDIHPFDLPQSIADVRAQLPDDLADQLDTSVKAHQAREFWTDMGLTAFELGLLLVPVVGPYLAVGVGLYSMSRSVDRIMDQQAMASASIRPDGSLLGVGGPGAFEWTMLAVEVALTAVDLGGVARQLRAGKSIRKLDMADLDVNTHLTPGRSPGAVGRAEALGTDSVRLGPTELPASMAPDDIAIRLDRFGRADGVLVGPKVTDGIAMQVHVELAKKLESRVYRMRLWLDSIVHRVFNPKLSFPEVRAARLEVKKQQMMVDRYLEALDELPLGRAEADDLLGNLENTAKWQDHWEDVLAGRALPDAFDPSFIFARKRLTPAQHQRAIKNARDLDGTALSEHPPDGYRWNDTGAEPQPQRLPGRREEGYPQLRIDHSVNPPVFRVDKTPRTGPMLKDERFHIERGEFTGGGTFSGGGHTRANLDELQARGFEELSADDVRALRAEEKPYLDALDLWDERNRAYRQWVKRRDAHSRSLAGRGLDRRAIDGKLKSSSLSAGEKAALEKQRQLYDAEMAAWESGDPRPSSAGPKPKRENHGLDAAHKTLRERKYFYREELANGAEVGGINPTGNRIHSDGHTWFPSGWDVSKLSPLLESGNPAIVVSNLDTMTKYTAWIRRTADDGYEIASTRLTDPKADGYIKTSLIQPKNGAQRTVFPEMHQ